MAGGLAVVLLAAGCSGAKQEAAPPLTTSTTAAPPTTAAPEATTTTAKPAPVRARPTGTHALASFASCSSLLSHVKREALRVVTPYGLPFGGGRRVMAAMGSVAGGPAANTVQADAAAADAAPGASASDYSGTNVQEAGVDEPDMWKSDGRRLVTIANNRLQVVDIAVANPRALSAFTLPPEDNPVELLLAGDRVIVFGTGYGYTARTTGRLRAAVPWVNGESSTVRVVDIADPARPKTVAAMTLEGRYVSARLVSGVVRLVMEASAGGPDLSWPQQEGDEARALAHNQAAIQRSTVADWIPSYRLERPGRKLVTAPLAPCSSVLRPKAFSGLGTVSVLTLDPADPQPTASACVLGAGRIVYASTGNVYVATEKYAAGPAGAAVDLRGDVVAPPSVSLVNTQLHQFAIAGREPAVYVASGEVDGSVLNQFSMSEHEGRLRVAATVRQTTGATENTVSVLEAQGGRLVSVGKLGGLGHAGETIQSVRFIGPRGYVVTFRQTDPLYVLDLADPRHPQATGELQVPGFSSYLHPLSASLLLGVGQGPGDQGGSGLQLSLFDVGDPAHPVRVANRVFANTYSDAQQDHHAFLWWAPTGQLVLPVRTSGAGADAMGAMVVPVDVAHPARGFGDPVDVTQAKHVSENQGYIQRAMVAGSRLLTRSPEGLLTSDLAGLAERSWLAFA
jgi:uncharacterized secreted protein with C-terminal beta-propeller domain